MKLVGLSAVPANGTQEAKSVSDFKCKTKGGNGAFREFSDLILSSKKIESSHNNADENPRPRKRGLFSLESNASQFCLDYPSEN